MCDYKISIPIFPNQIMQKKKLWQPYVYCKSMEANSHEIYINFSNFVIKILFKFHMNLGEWLLVRSSSLFQNTTSLLMKQYRIQELF